MTTKTKILIVDDDEAARQLFEQLLRRAGYEVFLAADAEQALEKASSTPVDIVLSDIRMPNLSGLELLQVLRERQMDCEVILITSFANVDSAIQALRNGAGDYLTRPISQAALLESITRAEQKLTQSRQRRAAVAMMEAGLKHFRGQPSPAPEPAPPRTPPERVQDRQYTVGPVRLDIDRFVVEVNGQRVDTTPSELELLHYFCRNPDRVVTPQEMVQAMRGYSVGPEEAAEIVRPHISNLRRKLIAASPQADVIVTVRGVGYLLQTPET
jgi:DNA-binding response OmpR family regulator